jgi:proline dehydrogenase
MLRRLILYFSTAMWARRIVTGWGVARRVARRFVAGETLDEAVSAAKVLNARKLAVTLDYLGESVHAAEDTVEVVSTYCAMLDRIAAEKLSASVSLKLTHLGLDIAEDLCVTNLRQILTRAQERGVKVTIDMENTPYTDTTLRIYRTMRDEYVFDNVGTVIQAYLRRSEADLRELGAEGAHIRLCKGAYLEAADLAFPLKADVDANYARLTALYLQTPGYLCIATHDEAMIQAAESAIKSTGAAQARYEFQMLYGIRSARQDELATAGYLVRVYVPFGAAWYPYFMRRLAERPANLWFFARGFFSR